MEFSIKMCEKDPIGTMIIADDPLVLSWMKNKIWNALSTLYSEDCGRLIAN